MLEALWRSANGTIRRIAEFARALSRMQPLSTRQIVMLRVRRAAAPVVALRIIRPGPDEEKKPGLPTETLDPLAKRDYH